jgi:hypothetical protein
MFFFNFYKKNLNMIWAPSLLAHGPKKTTFDHIFFQCMVILLIEMKKVMEKKKGETLNQ